MTNREVGENLLRLYRGLVNTRDAVIRISGGLITVLDNLDSRVRALEAQDDSSTVTELTRQVKETRQDIAAIEADLQKTKDVIDLVDLEERLAAEFGLSADGSGDRDGSER